MTKACSCRNFDEAAAGDAIRTGCQAEQVHRHVKGKEPVCGTCLPTIEALRHHFATTQQIPPVLELSGEELEQAKERLGRRYEEEEPDREQAPYFKRRYMPRR